MPGSVVCPSCGLKIDDVDGVCAVCGFTVRSATPAGGVAPFDAAVDSAADAAVDGPAAAPDARRGPAGWAPQAPSPPAGIGAPPPVSPPPSQISVDGLEVRWSNRLPRRPARAAATAAVPVASADAARVAAGGSTSASSRASAGRSASPVSPAAARGLSGAPATAARGSAGAASVSAHVLDASSRIAGRGCERRARAAGRGRASGGQGPRAPARADARAGRSGECPHAGSTRCWAPTFARTRRSRGRGRATLRAMRRRRPHSLGGRRRAPRPSPSRRGGAAARRPRPSLRRSGRRRAAARSSAEGGPGDRRPRAVLRGSDRLHGLRSSVSRARFTARRWRSCRYRRRCPATSRPCRRSSPG